MNEEIKRHQEEERQLRRLPIWSWYIDGARRMLMLLRENLLCEEPHQGDAKKVTAEDKIYVKATLDLIMDSKDNVDRFLSQDYDLIQFTDHERDKKGKLIKCRAYFAKRVTRIEEIKA